MPDQDPVTDPKTYFDLLNRTEPITESFWMVLSPEGVQPPHRMIRTRRQATFAAEKLAKRFPRQRFFVVFVAGQVHADGSYTRFNTSRRFSQQPDPSQVPIDTEEPLVTQSLAIETPSTHP